MLLFLRIFRACLVGPAILILASRVIRLVGLIVFANFCHVATSVYNGQRARALYRVVGLERCFEIRRSDGSPVPGVTTTLSFGS